MTKKIILLLLSFTLMVSSLCGCGSSNNEEIDMNQKKVEKMPKENFSEVENSDDSFIPVIRFAVCSDVHISNTDQVEAERFAKLFESAYRFSEENKYYKNLDAVIVVGDMTNSGYEAEYDAFKSIINENIKEDTQIITVMGNHEYQGGDHNDYLTYMDDSLDKHVVINGFHFIGLSPSPELNMNSYSQNQTKWLDNELSLAVAENPEKPIFTFQHLHIKNTVYVSRSWFTPTYRILDSVYKKYPNVINFSGDSHGPINNPLSIWQENYTLLGTGTLAYFEMEKGMTGGTLPKGKENAAQYLIVEVDANNVVKIYPYNILTDSIFKTPSNEDSEGEKLTYIIETPSDPESFIYTPERGNISSKPYFTSDAVITVESVTDDSISIVYPQAIDAECIYGYRVVAESLTKADAVRSETKHFSEYYFEPLPSTSTVKIQGLTSGTEYFVSVYPINAWGKEGNPISVSAVTTGGK